MISATMQPEFAFQGKAKRYSQRALKLKKDDPKLWLLGAKNKFSSKSKRMLHKCVILQCCTVRGCIEDHCTEEQMQLRFRKGRAELLLKEISEAAVSLAEAARMSCLGQFNSHARWGLGGYVYVMGLIIRVSVVLFENS